VIEIEVHAARVFGYANQQSARPALRLRATLAEGENVHDAVRELQVQAETLIEVHSHNLRARLAGQAKRDWQERQRQREAEEAAARAPESGSGASA
jgi:hypothetical protein